MISGMVCETRWKDRRPQHVQLLQLRLVLLGVAAGDHGRIFAALVRAADDLVVHVGEVHDVAHIIPFVCQVAADEVEHDGRHGVSDVRLIVDRRPADIHANLARLQSLKGLFLAGQRIVDNQGHRKTSRKTIHPLLDGRHARPAEALSAPAMRKSSGRRWSAAPSSPRPRSLCRGTAARPPPRPSCRHPDSRHPGRPPYPPG